MELTHDITIKEIYIPSKHDKESYLCENFIVYPEDKEVHGGYLLGIVEMRATPNDEGDRIIKLIINTLREQYYNQIKTSPDPSKLNLETVFEYALKKTNEALTEMIQIGHLNFELENLNYVLATAKPNNKTKDIDFFFCHQGLVQAYLLHKTKQSNYKVINIIDNTPRLKDDNNKIKVFSSILSGKIFFHDAIFLCSEIFNNYIPAHKVNKILSSNDLQSAIDYFKNLINNVRNNSFLTYSAIFIKLEEKREINDRPVSQKSIAKLMDTKDNTEKYLTPTFALNIRDYLYKFLDIFKRDKNQKLQGPKTEKKIFKLAAPVLSVLGKLKKGNGNSESVFFTKKKIIIIGSILILIIGGSGFTWYKYNEKKKKEAAEYAAQMKELRDSINNAQVNLIYKNDSMSLQLIQSAETKLASLPRQGTTQESNYQELSKQISTIKNKILKIEKAVPELFTDLSSEANINLKSSVGLTNALVVGGGNNTVYVINPQTKQVDKKITTESGDIQTIREADGTLYVLTNQTKMAKAPLTNTAFQGLTVNWQDINPSDYQLYNNNIYVAANGIYKVSGTSAPPTAWIKDAKGIETTNLSAVAIDGAIYAFDKNGSLYKFHAGERQDFPTLAVEPKLPASTKIFTNLDVKNIYLLDKENKRVVVLGKDGALIKQIYLDSLQDEITSLNIDNAEQKIIVTTKTKVYLANLAN